MIPKFAPVDIELGNDDGGSYEVEVVSMATSQIPSRRYDIVDLGDPAYFRGWADVQGTGSANDYCRWAIVGVGVCFGTKLCQISPKWDKFGTFVG